MEKSPKNCSRKICSRKIFHEKSLVNKNAQNQLKRPEISEECSFRILKTSHTHVHFKKAKDTFQRKSISI